MRQAFFLALFLLSSHSSGATSTSTRLIDAGNIDFFLSGGTVTTGTLSGIPQIVSIDITPKNITMTAGDSIRFSAEAVYDNGKVVPIASGFSTSGGSITPEGIFASSLAGRAVISNSLDGVRGVVEVAVLPSTPVSIQIDPPATLDYGTIYPVKGLFPYKVVDKFGNETEVDSSKITTTIKKNAPGNLITRLANNGGSAVSQYVAVLRPVLVNGYIAEGDNTLFFERGTYTITAQYGDMKDTKEFLVEFAAPYREVEAWGDYHMGDVNLDTRVVTVDYDDPVSGGMNTQVISLVGEQYDRFYDNGLLCKFKAICQGHYEILRVRQELIDGRQKRIINRVFMGLVAPAKGVK